LEATKITMPKGSNIYPLDEDDRLERLRAAIQYLTRPEAARLLNLEVQTLGNWAWKGEGPPMVKINARCVRYPLDGLLEWMKKREIRPRDEATK
jgi:predicted DNA-binding transcriptional regulator AlpA